MSVRVRVEYGQEKATYVYDPQEGFTDDQVAYLLVEGLSKTLRREGNVAGRMTRIEYRGPDGGRSLLVPPEPDAR